MVLNTRTQGTQKCRSQTSPFSSSAWSSAERSLLTERRRPLLVEWPWLRALDAGSGQHAGAASAALGFHLGGR